MNVLDWFNPARWILLAGIVAALVLGVPLIKHRYDEGLRAEGRQEVTAQFTERALIESEGKAREGLRRITKQQENQRAQDEELAVARAAAARNAADADRVRQQSAAAAREWGARLADSPTAQDVAAAAAAIAVLTDVRGRLDSAAGELAAYATASRAAGLKCERDYAALTLGTP